MTPTAWLFIRALRRFEDELQTRLHEAGYGDVSTAHMNLLRHVDREGMRITTLAEHAGVSKQAVSQGLGALVKRKLVKVEPDPEDRRAKRVVLTKRGIGLVSQAIVDVGALEREWSARVGERRYRAMRKALRDLIDADG